MLNLIIKLHAVIDKAICNKNDKDGMIHDIADYSTQQFKHIKGFHSVYPVFIILANSTIQLIKQCSGIFSTTQLTKSLFHNPSLFKLSQPLLTTIVGCRVIISSSTAIVLMTHIIFSISMFLSAFLSKQIDFNWPSSFLGGNLANVRLL